MKKHLAIVFGMLALPAFAEVSPIYYEYDAQYAEDGLPVASESEYVSEEVPATEQAQQPAPAVSAANPRATITRNVNRAGAVPSNVPVGRASTPSRAVAARTASSTAARQQTANTIRSRAAAGTVANNNSAVTARRAVSSQNANVARAGIVQTDTTNNPLYNAARVSVRTTPQVATTGMGSSLRSSTVRSASLGTATTEAVVEIAPTMEEIAQLTDFCKAQYYSCMDGFCNVLDDNQGRCSCSPNITKYAALEKGLKLATETLQKTAMDIQNIGYSKDEIITMNQATEAEVAMGTARDSTQLNTDIENIMKLVPQVKSASSVGSSNTSGIDFANVNFDNLDDVFSGFNFESFLGGGTTGTISNQRGEELYNTAASRCNSAVLTNCKAQGIDIKIISNGYNLEIDRQCIEYERSLEDSTTKMKRMSLNGTYVLKNLRLAVARNKNTYDMKGCVNALDSCMQNDFVCGSDYENCMDPTGRYIVAGKVVVGSQPGIPGGGLLNGVYKAWGYSKVTN
ncbi:MAG: hypothetical protein LBK26_00605, partial [Rickettsiales bacterium]|nr:hypothetical protein [Rickettsiales bacterium]